MILTNASIKHAEIRLTWTQVSGATSYDVEEKRGNSWFLLNSGDVSISTANSVVTAIITVSKPGNTFIHRARSKNALWVSDPSNEVTTTALDQRPNKPTGLRYDLMMGNRGIQVRWNAVSGSTSYEVQISDSSTFKSTRSIFLSSTQRDVTELIPNKPYHIKVIAKYQLLMTESDTITTINIPEPSNWWGHQPDHKVRYEIDGNLTNSVIKRSVDRAASSWNMEMNDLNKGLEICPDCGDNYTVKIKTVDDKNDSDGNPNSDPNEGCGFSYACVKAGESGGSIQSIGPGMHIQNMYIIFEDPPYTGERTPPEVGPRNSIRWVWTSYKNDDGAQIPTSNPARFFAYVDRVMMHEMGHALGLHDFYDDDAMKGLDAVMGSYNDIEKEDIEQLKAIYILHTSH